MMPPKAHILGTPNRKASAPRRTLLRLSRAFIFLARSILRIPKSKVRWPLLGPVITRELAMLRRLVDHFGRALDFGVNGRIFFSRPIHAKTLDADSVQQVRWNIVRGQYRVYPTAERSIVLALRALIQGIDPR